MLDATASSDDAVTRQRLSVLFDPATGRAVRGHTFVGEDDELSGPDGAALRERVLLEEAGEADAGRLRFADAPEDFRVEAGPVDLRVDDGRIAVRRRSITGRRLDPEVLRRLGGRS
ncbi:hypothetical protein [Agromyces sp. LHK192]|uniref:hypothetical protein n=1 Tax=Agromyces sp. LHK192 TaxID=2498704 RepID=UPI000FDA8D8B|nr:hypothetical protein [Agromyces sp. LHK192]